MKTSLLPPAFFRNLLVTLSVVLFFNLGLHGQDNNNSVISSTDDIRASVNTIKERANQAYNYAQQAYNATTLREAQASAKQTLMFLEEVKNIIKNAQTSLLTLSTQENKDKCGKYLNAIASDLIDLQNKTEGAIKKATKIITTNDFDNVNPAATAIIAETKKIATIVAESNTHIILAEQRLTSID